MIKYFPAEDIKEKVSFIVDKLSLWYVKIDRIFCIRSTGSKSNAVARIWALGKIWQKVLDIKSHYIIEVISERFDKLSEDEKNRTLIHELLHLPKAFGGGLLPHKKNITSYKINKLLKNLKIKKRN